MSIVLNGSTGITAPAINATNVIATDIETVTIEVNSKDVQSRLLAEYEVTGAAVTQIDFTGLDINSHKSYMVDIECKNQFALVSSIYMLINGDMTITNYWNNLLYATTNASSGRTNNPTIASMQPSSPGAAKVSIFRDIDGNVRAISNAIEGAPSILNVLHFSYAKIASVTNITRLTFASAVANAIGIGSKIRIYRGDV